MAITLQKTPDYAAIDGDGRAVHVAGTFGGQKRYNGGELFRSTNATNGNLALPSCKNFFGGDAGALGNCGSQIAETIRTGIPRADIIHSDSVRAIFIGEGARQAGDTSAHRVREKKAVDGLFDGVGRDGD